jgi:phosphatidylserine decarboxylase
MQTDETAIVEPADSRLLLGSLARTSGLFLKGKFFESEELFGAGKEHWSEAFRGDSRHLFCTGAELSSAGESAHP